MLPKVIIGVVVIVLGIIAFGFFTGGGPKQFPDFQNAPQQNQQGNQQSGSNPFYSKDGLYLTHSWPGEEHFSNEETEVLIFNESNSKVEVKSFDLIYSVEGKTYPHKSGTWEKFPSKQSWERIEYLNISAQYYQGQPLTLARGEKGKLHWHIQFGNQPLDGKQTVHVKLTLLKDNETINIDEQFNRDSGTVFSKDEH